MITNNNVETTINISVGHPKRYTTISWAKYRWR